MREAKHLDYGPETLRRKCDFESLGAPPANRGKADYADQPRLELEPEAGMKMRVVGKPAGVDLQDVETTPSAKADAVLVFVKTLAEINAKSAPAVEAAWADGLAWIAYPKAGQFGHRPQPRHPVEALSEAREDSGRAAGRDRRGMERAAVPAGEVGGGTPTVLAA